MFDSNLAYQFQTDSWNLPEWSYFVDEISEVFRLTKEEKASLNESITAKIIATIPFAAGCMEPERTAIAHLCAFMAELKGFQKYCAHLPEDDFFVFNRLDNLATFKGGDKKIIDHGMNILALIMVEGYKKSMKKDEMNGVYNPFVSGKWNYASIKNNLLKDISSISVPDLDCLLTTKFDLVWK